MKKLIFTLLFLSPMSLFSQNCDCKSNFNWVKNTFENNDAGFSYALESKSIEAYDQHNQLYFQKVKEITNPVDCAEALNEWLKFFRSGHNGIRLLSQGTAQDASKPLSDKKIIEKYKDSETLDIDLEEFYKYLESKQEIDYEGIWVSGIYKIGVKKVNNEYIGFIIEADDIYWKAGQVKFKINQENTTEYYMKDHSKEVFDDTQLLGNNVLKAGFISLNRVSPVYSNKPEIERYINSISADGPYFEMLNDQTAYLRIPSFNYTKKAAIDSIVDSNRAMILNSPYLIIDIRNNGGGSDASYEELLPILYTNPIRTVGVEFLSTSLNNQRMLDFVNDPQYGFDEEEKKWAQASYDKLSENEGDFVNLDTSIVYITSYDTVYAFPENIGIIINENNGSTAEQFLLAAKQSKKVKLFGTTTAGVLDISNMYFVTSPCEEFQVGYSLTRSMRIPEMTIDDKGIQPDYYIDEGIEKYNWIRFTAETLNK